MFLHQSFQSKAFAIRMQRGVPIGVSNFEIELWRNSIFISTVSSQLVHLIPFCLVWAEIECTVHVALPKRPINQFRLTVLTYILCLQGQFSMMQDQTQWNDRLWYCSSLFQQPLFWLFQNCHPSRCLLDVFQKIESCTRTHRSIFIRALIWTKIQK